MAKIQTNHAETLPGFVILPLCTVSFYSSGLFLIIDSINIFGYYEKHNPKVVLGWPKKNASGAPFL
jgi:hypothetical protein